MPISKIVIDNVMKKILFVLYAWVMLVVSFSCAHKKQSPDLTEAKNSNAVLIHVICNQCVRQRG